MIMLMPIKMKVTMVVMTIAVMEQIIWPCFCFQVTSELEISMGDDCRRFGFSVIGGADEGIPPKIDDIAKGECQPRLWMSVLTRRWWWWWIAGGLGLRLGRFSGLVKVVSEAMTCLPTVKIVSAQLNSFIWTWNIIQIKGNPMGLVHKHSV